MAASLECLCLIKDSVTLGLHSEVINMKKKFWLILYHLGGSVVLLLLLYTSLQGLTTVTLCLAIPVLAASIIEAKFERKFLRENPEIKKDKTYRIAKTLGYLCGLILVIGVWPRH